MAWRYRLESDRVKNKVKTGAVAKIVQNRKEEGERKAGQDPTASQTPAKKDLGLAQIDVQLAAKRAEFKIRMAACQERQLMLEKQEAKMKDKVERFKVFIKENDIKWAKASQKFQFEEKMKQQKKVELANTIVELAERKIRYAFLKKRLQWHKKFETYLNEIVDALPDTYLDVTDSVLGSLILRHSTLSSTKEDSVDYLLKIQDEHDELKKKLDELNIENHKQKVSLNSEVGALQRKLEAHLNFNADLEQKNALLTSDTRTQFALLGQVMMAINNLAESCSMNHETKNLSEMALTSRLHLIKDYFIERLSVVLHVKERMKRKRMMEANN